MKTMPCMHMYHSKCIDRWLATSNSCPVCKTPIGQDPSVAPTPAGVLLSLSQQFSLSAQEAAGEVRGEELPGGQPRSQSRCSCGSARSSCCHAGQFDHACICLRGTPAKCKAHVTHQCVCNFEMSASCRARPLAHTCICNSGFPAKCKANDHPCLCGSGMTSRCRAGPFAHDCVCNSGTPSMCRAAYHPCVCRTGTTSHCRVDHGAHDCICGSGMSCRCRADRHIL